MIKIVFSFDDGRSDAFEAAKILKQHLLFGSFHVVTGFVDKTFHTYAFGTNRLPLTIDELKQMKEMGMEISSHGDKHIMDKSDFEKSHSKLLSWGLADEKIGFSIPNSKYIEPELKKFINDTQKNISYIRAGRSPKCYSFSSKINYALYHLFKMQTAYDKFNYHNLNNADEKSVPFYSVVITKSIKAKSVVSYLKKHENENKIAILMFHSIVEKAKDKWEYSIKNFNYICSEISNLCAAGKMECHTLKDLFK